MINKFLPIFFIFIWGFQCSSVPHYGTNKTTPEEEKVHVILDEKFILSSMKGKETKTINNITSNYHFFTTTGTSFTIRAHYNDKLNLFYSDDQPVRTDVSGMSLLLLCADIEEPLVDKNKSDQYFVKVQIRQKTVTDSAIKNLIVNGNKINRIEYHKVCDIK